MSEQQQANKFEEIINGYERLVAEKKNLEKEIELLSKEKDELEKEKWEMNEENKRFLNLINLILNDVICSFLFPYYFSQDCYVLQCDKHTQLLIF